MKSLPIDTAEFTKELVQQDGCLSCLFHKVPSEELGELADLDKCLEDMRLDFARITLLNATGRKSIVLAEMKEVPGFTEGEFDIIMKKLADQPAFSQLPEHLCDEGRTICRFKTRLFGVTYNIRCRNKIGPLLFAENLLGVLESALAFAKWENLAFVVDEVNIFIDENDAGENPPKISFQHFACGREQQLVCNVGMLEWMRTNVSSFRAFLHRLLLQMLLATTIDPLKDLERELDNWHKEKSFERALASSPTSVAIIDLLQNHCYDLNYWINTAASP